MLPLARLRPATAADAGALVRLAGQLGYAITPDAARACAAEGCGGLHVAQGPDDEVIGFVEWGFVQGILAPRFLLVQALVVDDAHRGRGVGAALVAVAAAAAREAGCERMVVRSRVSRDRAHAFYRRLGFDLSKTQHVFVRDS